MPASMWRMNVAWRGKALALLLCALLLNNGVMCQDATDAPATDATDSPADTADTQAPADSDATAAPGDNTAATDTVATGAPGALPFSVSMIDFTGLPDFGVQAGGETSGTSGTTAGPAVVISADTQGTEATDAPPAAPETSAPLQPVLPVVQCVDKDAMMNRNSLKAVVATTDCETTKGFLQGVPAAWCSSDPCRLDVYQEGNTLQMASPDAEMFTLADALRSEHEAGPLGVSEIEAQPTSSGSSVFVAVLLTGLLLAAALIGGYCLKTRRGSSPKGMRLAEEAYPADETNQGNTLVSVAPLNPPTETPEKPSVNGESPEADKTQPPPTNGHSTAKNADTEL